MSFLELHDISTHFPISKGMLSGQTADKVKAVDGVSLQIEKGEILGLVGESGCGKSTLSRTVMQLIPADIRLGDPGRPGPLNLGRQGIRRRRLDFQMIFQDPYASLNPRMTVFSTLAEAVRQRHRKLSGDALTSASPSSCKPSASTRAT